MFKQTTPLSKLFYEFLSHLYSPLAASPPARCLPRWAAAPSPRHSSSAAPVTARPRWCVPGAGTLHLEAARGAPKKVGQKWWSFGMRYCQIMQNGFTLAGSCKYGLVTLVLLPQNVFQIALQTINSRSIPPENYKPQKTHHQYPWLYLLPEVTNQPGHPPRTPETEPLSKASPVSQLLASNARAPRKAAVASAGGSGPRTTGEDMVGPGLEKNVKKLGGEKLWDPKIMNYQKMFLYSQN